MSHPGRSTAPVWQVLRPPSAGAVAAAEHRHPPEPRKPPRRTGTRWVKGRAGPAPPRSRSRRPRIHPCVPSRRAPRAPSPRRRRQEGGRSQSGGPGWRAVNRNRGRGRRRPSSGHQVPSSGRTPFGTRGTGARGTGIRGTGSRRRRAGDRTTGLQGTGGRGAGRDRTLSTRPETDGGQATATAGGLRHDQPILIRRWHGPRRPCRRRGAPTRKAFGRGLPITQRIRRSPARRRPQTRGLLGILTQNGARKG
jgi:hypothetical protein